MKKKRILVALSGGVDSAVSAYLLKQQGHEVIAGFMKNYADPSNPYCHTRQDRDMAIQVAQHIGIQDFIIFDFRETYHTRIIEYIYQGYRQGITPNPDILCNNLIKFDIFLEKALRYGCDGIATGHYARIIHKPKGYYLLRGIDRNKDQSYFLYRLTQNQLSKACFPIGEMNKAEVRKLAKDIGLPNADRKESQGLCFIGNIPMKKFLQKKLPIQKGDILLDTGQKIGEHDGAWFRTIGQSRGLNINKKAYVIDTDVSKNIIYVSYDKNHPKLRSKKAICTQWHRINPTDDNTQEYATGKKCVGVKIRYRQNPPVMAQIQRDKKHKHMHINFLEPQRGIAPGQSIVVYDMDYCLGGGIII